MTMPEKPRNGLSREADVVLRIMVMATLLIQHLREWLPLLLSARLPVSPISADNFRLLPDGRRVTVTISIKVEAAAPRPLDAA